MALITLKEIKARHERLGDDGFFKWLANSKESSDIEAFAYTFRLQQKLGGLQLYPQTIADINAIIDKVTLETVTEDHYNSIEIFLTWGGELFAEGIPLIEGPSTMRFHRGPSRTPKKKKRRK